MNAKHYVSLEAAKKLKELGYNEDTEYAYNEINMCMERMCANANGISDYYSCPTLLEAMDWLDEKGIFISIEHGLVDNEWQYFVYSSKYYPDDIYETNRIIYTDRNECMNAAIKKGLELL